MIKKEVALSWVKVLIETLWNVKEDREREKIFPKHSINRNIMECKDQLQTRTDIVECRINRNIMECKVAIALAEEGAEVMY